MDLPLANLENIIHCCFKEKIRLAITLRFNSIRFKNILFPYSHKRNTTVKAKHYL